MKFRGCDSVSSNENVPAGYRYGSRIVHWWCVNKTSLNYGADTNLSFIITYEIPRLHLDELNRKYPGRFQKRTLKIEYCNQQLFTLTMCLPACLWARTGRTDRVFDIFLRWNTLNVTDFFAAKLQRWQSFTNNFYAPSANENNTASKKNNLLKIASNL